MKATPPSVLPLKGLIKDAPSAAAQQQLSLLLPDTFHLREPAAPPLLLPETWRTSLATETWVSVKLGRGDAHDTLPPPLTQGKGGFKHSNAMPKGPESLFLTLYTIRSRKGKLMNSNLQKTFLDESRGLWETERTKERKGNGTRQGHLSLHLKGCRKSHQLQKDLNILFLKKMYTSARLGPQSSASERALPETSETDISELGEEAMPDSPRTPALPQRDEHNRAWSFRDAETNIGLDGKSKKTPEGKNGK